jgi:CRP-like cAMP-binding protein
MGEGVDPTQMCQSLVDKVAQSKQLMAITDPELLVLFEDWLEELEAEVLALVKSPVPLSSKVLAENLGLSVRGATFLLSKLARAGKLTDAK